MMMRTDQVVQSCHRPSHPVSGGLEISRSLAGEPLIAESNHRLVQGPNDEAPCFSKTFEMEQAVI